MTTTMEEARKCPRCSQYGQPAGKTPGPRGSTIHQFECKTKGCRWEDTKWIVQVNRDGSIPVRSQADKEFKKLPDTVQQKARDRRRFHDMLMQGEELRR